MDDREILARALAEHSGDRYCEAFRYLYLARADACLAALAAAGKVIVPQEPTEEMYGAAYLTGETPSKVWRAMLAALAKR